MRGAYPGDCDFSIGFLPTRRAGTYDERSDGVEGDDRRLLVNPGVGEPVMAFPSIELIATAGWSAPIAIEDRTIHIWGFSLDGSQSFVEQCRLWLSEDERGRAARFVRQQDQQRFVLAHGGLRAVLARYTGLDPSALTFRLGSTGKPALLDRRALQHPLPCVGGGRHVVLIVLEEVELLPLRGRVCPHPFRGLPGGRNHHVCIGRMLGFQRRDDREMDTGIDLAPGVRPEGRSLAQRMALPPSPEAASQGLGRIQGHRMEHGHGMTACGQLVGVLVDHLEAADRPARHAREREAYAESSASQGVAPTGPRPRGRRIGPPDLDTARSRRPPALPRRPSSGGRRRPIGHPRPASDTGSHHG